MNKKNIDKNKNSSNENGKSFKGFKGFVDFIKKQKTGVKGETNNGPSGQEKNIIIFSIVQGALILGIPMPICYIKGKTLFYYSESKLLSNKQLNDLYSFIKSKKDNGEFFYLSTFDFTIIDGNSFSIEIKWGEINLYESGGNTMPKGIHDLLDYCREMVK